MQNNFKERGFIGILVVIFAIAIVVFVAGYYYLRYNRHEPFIFSFDSLRGKKSIDAKINQDKFAHFLYVEKPAFGNSASSSIAKSDQYKTNSNLPSAQELIKKSKISQSFNPLDLLIKPARAESEVSLPIYIAQRHAVTIDDAKNLAGKFGISGDPKREGFDPPGYYGFIWNNFSVTGGSGSGGFEYYVSTPNSGGNIPDNEQAKQAATNFLKDRGVYNPTDIVSGVLGDVGDTRQRTGVSEDHKQVYFRQTLEGYPVYNWIAGQGSPIVDSVEVWVGLNNRILYASNPTFWTTVDQKAKRDFKTGEPSEVFESVKQGNGKIGWIDYEQINVMTGGYGPMAPDGNFIQGGELKDVVVEDVTLAYYHQSKGIQDLEIYQPIYIFTTKATLDWKDGYDASYQSAQFIKGKRTTVAIVAPAVLNSYFYETPLAIVNSDNNPPPVYYPSSSPVASPSMSPSSAPATPQPSAPLDSLKLEVTLIQELEDPKRNVHLKWNQIDGVTKYKLMIKLFGENSFSPFIETSNLAETAGINKYMDYYFQLEACNNSGCIKSNEIYIPQMQRPSFSLKIVSQKVNEDTKDLQLEWGEIEGALKYNVFVKNSQVEDYGAAVAGIGDTSYLLTINKSKDNYIIVQACKEDSCFSSNEIILAKE